MLCRMVNNAGVSLESRHPARIHETTNELYDTTMRINTRSVFLGSKYAIMQMLKQDPHPSGDRGWIINLSSILGIVAATENRVFIPTPAFPLICSLFVDGQ